MSLPLLPSMKMHPTVHRERVYEALKNGDWDEAERWMKLQPLTALPYDKRTQNGSLFHALSISLGWTHGSSRLIAWANRLVDLGEPLEARRGRPRDSTTALGQAVKDKREILAECLITRGADVNAMLNDNMSILGTAVLGCSMGLIHRLITAGAHVQPLSADPVATVLHAAVRTDTVWQKKVVDLLLSHGADINAQDKFGETPLHWAVEWRAAGMCAHLVNRGASVEILEKEGLTALDFARQDAYRAISDTSPLTSMQARAQSQRVLQTMEAAVLERTLHLSQVDELIKEIPRRVRL